MHLDLDIFKIESNNIAPAKGKLLVSEPFSQDAYFKRSVVLVTEHNEEGTIGFILNKPVMITLKEVRNDLPEFEAHVSLGGPVSPNTIHYIHKLGDMIPNSVNIFGNVYWGGDFEVMKQLLASGQVSKDDIRFFLGYSGWSPNQLDGELQRNSWIVTDAIEEKIMENTEYFWKDVLKYIGGKYKLWPNFPENPKLN